jgi:hypothetical protein
MTYLLTIVKYRLKGQYHDVIRADAQLTGMIAKAIGVSAYSMNAILWRDSPKLTQKAALVILSKYTGKSENELVEVVKEEVQTV